MKLLNSSLCQVYYYRLTTKECGWVTIAVHKENTPQNRTYATWGPSWHYLPYPHYWLKLSGAFKGFRMFMQIVEYSELSVFSFYDIVPDVYLLFFVPTTFAKVFRKEAERVLKNIKNWLQKWWGKWVPREIMVL